MAETSPEFDFLAKTMIVGESGVGKTSIWYRFCDNTFLSDHKTTIGVEIISKTIEVDGKKVKIQLWDTAGQERFRALPQASYRFALGMILSYAINHRESFVRIGYWMDEIKKYASKDVCIVLLGTKSDLCDERVVSFDEGRQRAESLGIKFFETSAKENSNIEEVVLTLARDISQVLSEKANENQAVGTQIKLKENNPKIETNCFRCF